MKTVTRIQTSDGELHLTLDNAKHHAEARYANALTKLAYSIVSLNWKYNAVIEFIDAKLPEFEAALKLRQDIDVEPTNEDT